MFLRICLVALSFVLPTTSGFCQTEPTRIEQSVKVGEKISWGSIATNQREFVRVVNPTKTNSIPFVFGASCRLPPILQVEYLGDIGDVYPQMVAAKLEGYGTSIVRIVVARPTLASDECMEGVLFITAYETLVKKFTPQLEELKIRNAQENVKAAIARLLYADEARREGKAQ